jgi:hypothetical protein
VTQGAYNYQWQDTCITPKRIQGLKTDYLPNSKDRIALGLRRWWSDDRAFTCFVVGYSNLPLLYHHYNYSTDNALITWTHIVSPTSTNEFNIGTVGEKERGQVPGPFPECQQLASMPSTARRWVISWGSLASEPVRIHSASFLQWCAESAQHRTTGACLATRAI